MPRVAYSLEEKQRLRQELVAVALELMAKQGIQHTTVEQIYQKVGISRSFFYSFFPTKEDLVVEALYLQQPRILAYAKKTDGRPYPLLERGRGHLPPLLLLWRTKRHCRADHRRTAAYFPPAVSRKLSDLPAKAGSSVREAPGMFWGSDRPPAGGPVHQSLPNADGHPSGDPSDSAPFSA